MEFIRSWKFMAIILAVLALAAGILVAVGVATHEEAGLMPDAPTWPRERFPLAVCPEAYLDTSDDLMEAVTAVGEACDATNQRLGFPALEVRTDDCDVTVLVGVPSEPGMEPGGDARFRSGPSCAIRTANTGTSEILHLVLQHELGHCLGLAHDDFDTSIMRPVQTPTPDRTFPPRITDADRELLRALYGPPG